MATIITVITMLFYSVFILKRQANERYQARDSSQHRRETYTMPIQWSEIFSSRMGMVERPRRTSSETVVTGPTYFEKSPPAPDSQGDARLFKVSPHPLRQR